MSEPDNASGPGSEAEPTAQWLVRCSRDRVLIARRDADGDDLELIKIYETGTLEEAEREVRLARSLGVDGIVQVHRARLDPATSRPSVVMEYLRGENLEEWLAQRGPMSPRAAAHVARNLARVLDQLHAATSQVTPYGVVHCDVKPGNALLVGESPDPLLSPLVLVDLEQAFARPAVEPEASPDRGFTGGTHGYAPPEAYAGTAPTPGFDVFGLGAVLQALLTGGEAYPGHDPEQVARAVRRGERQRGLLAPLPTTLTELIDECLHTDPQRRPSLAEIGARLEDFLTRVDEGERDHDLALHAIWSNDLDDAAQRLPTLDPTRPRTATLRDLYERRRRLLARVVPPRELAQPAPSLQARAETLAEVAPRTAAWLERFPSDPRVLQQRREITRRVDRLLRDVPPTVKQHVRAAQFDAARHLIDAALEAASRIASFPGRVPIADASASTMPGPLQRDPIRFLRLAREDITAAARTHGELCEQLRDAEARLDLDAAQHILDNAAGLYSGANEVVAGLKDRLHRFGFYLERIAQPERELTALREQAQIAGLEVDLRPLEEFTSLCCEQTKPTATNSPANVRHLRQTLRDLVEEFPHTRDIAAAAARSLERISATFTQRGWEMLVEARRLLSAEPIPIRPLQSLLNRADRLRMLEILVDLPDHTRAEFLDELERVRLKIERARATRDRLARGARAAMDRGHLTTALYDMERVVDQFETGTGEGEPERQRLVQQLEQAREKKQILEASAATNRSLAQRYEQMRDDPGSRFETRLGVLEERRQTLQFLIDNLQEDRARGYRDDLRELSVTVLQERADHAQRLLDATDDPQARLRISRETVDEITRAAEIDSAHEPLGRVRRVLAHWQTNLERAEQALEQRARHNRRRAQRGWLLAAAIGTLLIAGFVLGRCAG